MFTVSFVAGFLPASVDLGLPGLVAVAERVGVAGRVAEAGRVGVAEDGVAVVGCRAPAVARRARGDPGAVAPARARGAPAGGAALRIAPAPPRVGPLATFAVRVLAGAGFGAGGAFGADGAFSAAAGLGAGGALAVGRALAAGCSAPAFFVRDVCAAGCDFRVVFDAPAVVAGVIWSSSSLASPPAPKRPWREAVTLAERARRSNHRRGPPGRGERAVARRARLPLGAARLVPPGVEEAAVEHAQPGADGALGPVGRAVGGGRCRRAALTLALVPGALGAEL